jgi:ubiquinone/menaquinone biosynthesis C-methylase UbiE
MTMADDRVRGAWRRAEPLFEAFTWPLALRMAAVTAIGPGQRVLDVGCGVGDPTLQVAVLVGPHGRVLGIDLVEDLLVTARERAAALGLAHAEFVAADVLRADLGIEQFDAILARWSLPYVEDVAAALRRLRVTLAPNGRIAVAGWAPREANPWITIPLEALARECPVPALDPVRPGPFHLSADGELVRALVQEGFQAVGQERVMLSLVARDLDEVWAVLGAADAPLAALAGGLDAEARERVRRAMATALAPYHTGDVWRVPAQAQLAWGRG